MGIVCFCLQKWIEKYLFSTVNTAAESRYTIYKINKIYCVLFFLLEINKSKEFITFLWNIFWYWYVIFASPFLMRHVVQLFNKQDKLGHVHYCQTYKTNDKVRFQHDTTRFFCIVYYMVYKFINYNYRITSRLWF